MRSPLPPRLLLSARSAFAGASLCVGGAMLIAGCSAEKETVLDRVSKECNAYLGDRCPMARGRVPWTLARVYDITAFDTVAQAEASFAWRPSEAMQKSCGPARTPVDIGLTEGEALALGLLDTLVIELEGPWDATRPLDRDTVEIWLNIDGMDVLGDQPQPEQVGSDDEDPDEEPLRHVRLEPAVMPRGLRIEVTTRPDDPPELAPEAEADKTDPTADGEAEDTDAEAILDESAVAEPTEPPDDGWQQGSVRRAMALQLCLEHKLGRGWRGLPSAELREALLLDQPDEPRDSTLAFVGQGARVPMMLGAPDACFTNAPPAGSGQAIQRADRTAPYLHASDVWNGDLRQCGEKDGQLGEILPAPSVPLFLQHGALWTLALPPIYEEVKVEVSATRGAAGAHYAPTVSLQHTRLESRRPLGDSSDSAPPVPPLPKGARQDDRGAAVRETSTDAQGNTTVTVRAGDPDRSTVALTQLRVTREKLFGAASDGGTHAGESAHYIRDLVAEIPLRYPEFHRADLDGFNNADKRVVALLIPAWQLLPVDREYDAETMMRLDPIGRLLAEPHRLQVRVLGAPIDGATGPDAEGTWHELNPSWSNRPLSGWFRRSLDIGLVSRDSGLITVGFQSSETTIG